MPKKGTKKGDAALGKTPEARANQLANLQPPWEPGVSANPSGRGKQPITDAYRIAQGYPVPDDLRAKLKKVGIILPVDATMAEAIAASQVRKALTDVSSAREVREALEGRATTRIELTGENGGPVAIEDVDEKLRAKLFK